MCYGYVYVCLCCIEMKSYKCSIYVCVCDIDVRFSQRGILFLRFQTTITNKYLVCHYQIHRADRVHRLPPKIYNNENKKKKKNNKK